MKMDCIISAVEEKGFVKLEGEAAKATKADIESNSYGTLLPQDDKGTYIYSVKMQSGIKNTASSQGTLKIEPHTDGALTDNPPKYVALYGQYVPDDESCRTHVCKVSSLFGFLTSEERQILGFPELKGRSFRYSFQQALYGDFWISEEKLNKRPPDSPEVIAAANRMAEAFTKFGSSIKIGMGDLLIIDNQCSLHYRDNVSSPERHLLRYWIG